MLAASSMAQSGPLLNNDDWRFLREMTTAVLHASRVQDGEKVGAIGPNVTGGTLVRPGGRNSYPAFWIRDYAMSLDAGLVTPDEQRHMLLLTASHQQDTEWRLANGSVVPPGSVPDHISFGNRPIFYPGTLEDYEGQGGPRWGVLPSLDDAYFFIAMAHGYVRQTGDDALLASDVRGKSLVQRLDEAYRMPPSRTNTGLVYADDANRGVTFGFVDTIVHTGDLLFCSLLKFDAARQLAELFDAIDRPADAARYRADADRIRAAIGATFPLDSGLYRASTGKSAQPDVWGTAYGVYIGAFDDPRTRAACRALADAYRAGTLAWRGNIRHVLTTDDFSAETAWEVTDVAKDRYQNGAYWGTPVGWVCYAIAQADWPAAQQLAREYVQELRDGDFRKGPAFGSPWECMHPAGDHKQNPVYLASVTAPLAAFERIERERR
ncbi:MAG: hypothetical protein FJY92_00125 [Candidatus Hydrogenedentes bacterium]|nr:hypothetical protein [Candidatus Hydrogenedentota bacterium]